MKKIGVIALAFVLGAACGIVALMAFNYFTTDTTQQQPLYTGEDLLALNTMIQKAYPKSCTDCTIFPPDRVYGNYYDFSWGDADGSVFGVAVKQSNGSFVLAFTTQSIPYCSQLEKYKVPHQMVPTCYDDQTNNQVANQN